MDPISRVREHLSSLLDWGDAHARFETIIKDVAPELRGAVPEGLPYSPWQLLEHLRLSQQDILEFCRNPNYVEKHWPDDYWPSAAGPPDTKSWEKSVREFGEDQRAFQQLASTASVDLLAKIPHGTGQTYLREILLVADHNAYHLGQLVAVRRLLGDWPS
jgi:uncharacterized damage-inducible protein DinB